MGNVQIKFLISMDVEDYQEHVVIILKYFQKARETKVICYLFVSRATSS